MISLPGKIVVVQVSSGASCNASLPSTMHRKRLVNRLAQRTAPREASIDNRYSRSGLGRWTGLMQFIV
jgi:hypothetical protein